MLKQVATTADILVETWEREFVVGEGWNIVFADLP